MRDLLLGAVFVSVAAAAGPACAQKSADTVRIPMLQPISGIDSYLDPGPEPDFRVNAVFDSLIVFDEAKNAYVGLLAKSWRNVDDRTLEFELRDDATWHDGQKLDADDVVHTLNWGMNPAVRLREKRAFAWIEKVEKLGPYKIRLMAKAPTAEAEAILASTIYILPEHIHGKLAPTDTLSFGFKPIGSGPFRATVVDKNKGVFLKKFAGYRHGNAASPAAQVENLHLLFMPDLDVHIAQFLTGNLDILTRITLDQMEYLSQQKGVATKLIQGPTFTYLALDAAGYSKNKAMTDPRVRKAMFMAMDRRDYLRLEAGDRKADRDLPDGMCFKDQFGCDYSVTHPPFDVAGAKRLLAEAGYAGGFDLHLGTFTSLVQHHAVIAAGQLSKIGIRPHIEKYTIPNFRAAMRDHTIEVMVGGFPVASIPDVANVVGNFFDVPQVYDFHNDAELKTMGQEMGRVLDPLKRKELGRKMFDRAIENHYFMPLGPRLLSVAYRDQLDIELSRYVVVGLVPGKMRWK